MPTDIRLLLGRKLRKLRKEHLLTQISLAHKAGISVKYLQNLEGKTPKKATIVILDKLAKGFSLPLETP